MRLFKRKQVQEDTPLFVSAYTQYGFASHLSKPNSWVSLCGAEVVKHGHQLVTPSEVRNSIPSQHTNFYYCGLCAEAVTGVPAAAVRLFREDD